MKKLVFLIGMVMAGCDSTDPEPATSPLISYEGIWQPFSITLDEEYVTNWSDFHLEITLETDSSGRFSATGTPAGQEYVWPESSSWEAEAYIGAINLVRDDGLYVITELESDTLTMSMTLSKQIQCADSSYINCSP